MRRLRGRASVSAMLPPVRDGAVAFLGLGSNVGDRLANLQHGVDLVDADARTRIEGVSRVYETDPVGPEQDRFLNMVARVSTRRSPAGLLRVCHVAEQARGRERVQRWGPRTLDVDILLYGDRKVATPALEVPHPRLAERPFALVPLVEIAPGMTLPDGTPLRALLDRHVPVEGVDLFDSRVLPPAREER